MPDPPAGWKALARTCGPEAGGIYLGSGGRCACAALRVQAVLV